MALCSIPLEYNKVAVACWPITRAIGQELERQLKLLFVFNKGKSAIFSTVNGDVYALGLNPSGVLGTGQDQSCPCYTPTRISGIKQGNLSANSGVQSDSETLTPVKLLPWPVSANSQKFTGKPKTLKPRTLNPSRLATVYWVYRFLNLVCSYKSPLDVW